MPDADTESIDDPTRSKSFRVAVTAVGAIVLALTSNAAPSGSRPVDVVLLLLVGIAGISAAATAPWWAVAVVGVVGAGAASGSWLIAGVVAVVAALGSALPRSTERWLPVLDESGLRQVSAASAFVALAHVEIGQFLGDSTLLAIVLGTAVGVTGWRAGNGPRRRVVVVVTALALLVVVVAAAGLGLAVLRAKSELSSGNNAARRAVKALNAGDFDGARALLSGAQQNFERAHDELSAPWAWPSAVVPVLAQHRSLGLDVSSSAVRILSAAASAAAQIDPDKLRVQNGRIDVAAVAALEAPFSEVRSALADLQTTLTESRSPWIAAPITDKLAEVADDFVGYDRQADNAIRAAHLAPELLGASTPRKYFVAFTTPAESRGLGGLMGNYGILTVDDGKISLGDFGRSDDLVAGAQANPSGLSLTGFDEFLARYGRFGFEDPATGHVEPIAWKNITVAADLATFGTLIQQLYPQSGGSRVDGVIVMDPFVVAALLKYTGPITVEGAPMTLTADNALDFLLKGQYEIADKSSRVDLLAATTEVTLDKILGGALPPPVQLAKDLGPFARADRLMIWSSHPDDEGLLERLGLSGHFPKPVAPDAVAVTLNNAGTSKLDAYLDVSATCEVVPDQTGGELTDVVQLTFSNRAPAEGLPKYVYGNLVDGVVGTNRTFVSVYSRSRPLSVERDSHDLPVESGTELGMTVVSQFLNIGPESSTTVRLTYQRVGTDRTSGCSVALPPLATR